VKLVTSPAIEASDRQLQVPALVWSTLSTSQSRTPTQKPEVFGVVVHGRHVECLPGNDMAEGPTALQVEQGEVGGNPQLALDLSVNR